MYSGGPPICATCSATLSVGTISIASHGQTVSSYGLVFFCGMWTQTSQPTHRSKSISHHCWVPFTMPRSIVRISMQSTGQTSRHDSQPVQLSALMTANSLGTFLRGPSLAIIQSRAESPESRARTINCKHTLAATLHVARVREIYHNLRIKSAAGQG